jgi:hypothetical protein
MSMRFRQIHLDFHTSEQIRGVGSEFSKANFQEALQRGHVDSITVFAKCHHGLSYYDTKVAYAHPHLAQPLLPLMIEAAAEIGVKTPIYISAGVDEHMIHQHPEWGVKAANGGGFNPLAAGFKALCFNTPYLDYLCAQIEEVAQLFPGHGLFLDIIGLRRCFCTWCMRGMEQAGVDPRHDEAVVRYQYGVLLDYHRRTTEALRRHSSAAPIFHNAGHISRGFKEILPWFTHLELESLPTGGWGYDHFPLSARYAITTGFDFLGMTGKFHTTWGEFGGYKKPVALQYETAHMIALGARCSVGDQLHPNGRMDADTYELVGAAYAEVERREAWCANVTPVSEIAILSEEAISHGFTAAQHDQFGDEGAARMLLESQIPFTVIDTDADFSQYRLIIFPDGIRMDPALAAKVRAYLAGGGSALLSYCSGMAPDRDAFVLETTMGARGESPWTNDYILAGDTLAAGLVRSPFVTYRKAMMVDPGQATVLAAAWKPYFNRDYNHFCSHQHTPYAGDAGYPAVVREGAVIYFAHPIFSLYRSVGQPLYKQLVMNALRQLLPDGLPVTSNLPSTARLNLMRQGSRLVLHVLHAVPVKRGASPYNPNSSIEVIEDRLPLHDVELSLRVEGKVSRVCDPVSGCDVPFAQADGRVSLHLDRVDLHEMRVLEMCPD